MDDHAHYAGDGRRGDREAPSVPAEPRLGLVAQVRLAFTIAFAPRYAYIVGLLGALGMLGLLTWSGGFVTYYPSSGWDFYASTQETATMVVLAVLFGMLLPLEVAAIGKARSAAGSAGGLFGTIFGILSMSCCAPLILPALLSFIGFSGMTLLQVNVTVHEWVTPLTLASIGFMLVAIALGADGSGRSGGGRESGGAGHQNARWREVDIASLGREPGWSIRSRRRGTAR